MFSVTFRFLTASILYFPGTRRHHTGRLRWPENQRTEQANNRHPPGAVPNYLAGKWSRRKPSLVVRSLQTINLQFRIGKPLSQPSTASSSSSLFFHKWRRPPQRTESKIHFPIVSNSPQVVLYKCLFLYHLLSRVHPSTHSTPSSHPCQPCSPWLSISTVVGFVWVCFSFYRNHHLELILHCSS